MIKKFQKVNPFFYFMSDQSTEVDIHLILFVPIFPLDAQ